MTIEKRLFNFSLWLIAVCILAAVLTSCNPYQGLQIAMATAQPSATLTISKLQDATFESTPRACTVNAAKVYLRNGAGMSHAAIDVLHSGDVLRVLNAAEWLNVETSQHITGWVYSKYCR